MAERPALSKGEMTVARALWKVGPAIVRDIFEEVTANERMSFSTVQTYLRRLQSKGYANSRLKGRLRVFSARTRPTTVIRETVDEFVDRLFGGESMPLVRHLIEERGINKADLDELRNLLESYEAEGNSDE
ncbi:BlaI/MecI/CopY family transcriptional regulator [Mariniblastus fucicola]|uniref:Penicillinase repressor n=1 Tax=Mariniblastus fucicola TaxID=980251 RepID=A0A5B9P156_9BACT|nr:BlaI/MecI/CopY family transcriptional regulator [Mariniblastus fucicola]QEG20227.1 Penicillinase repressor [Mariniblastus fucicola]